MGGGVATAPTSVASIDEVRSDLAQVETVIEAEELQRRYSAIVDLAKKSRQELSVVNQAVAAKLWTERRAGELLAALPEVGPGKPPTLGGFGLTYNQSSRWQSLARIPEPEFEAFITETIGSGRELSTAAALKLAKRSSNTQPDGSNGPAERPPMDDLSVVPDVWTTIVIDPPWRYDNVATRGAAEDHYETMSQAELLDLDVPSGDEAHLYLWVTNSFFEDGFELLRAWGFIYKTCLTWCKPQIGMGNYFRSTTEHVLFGVKGRLATLRNDVPTHFVSDRRRHSEKPDCFYDLAEACSPGPYLEMFARRRRFGWHVWGAEA